MATSEMTEVSDDDLRALMREARDIADGKIGFPRCVEWQQEFVMACYLTLPRLLDRAALASPTERDGR